MNLEVARNPHATLLELDKLIEKFVPENRDLGEALILNHSLTSNQLLNLLNKCSISLKILAIKHPNLPIEERIKIAFEIQDDDLRTKAKYILLERNDLDEIVLSALSLDPNKTIREKAQRKIKEIYDPHNRNC